MRYIIQCMNPHETLKAVLALLKGSELGIDEKLAVLESAAKVIADFAGADKAAVEFISKTQCN